VISARPLSPSPRFAIRFPRLLTSPGLSNNHKESFDDFESLARGCAFRFSVSSYQFIPVSVLGDEGMFLPDTLNDLPIKKLQQMGLKIPLTDILHPNGPSIKDAVVIVMAEPASSCRRKACC